MKSKTLKEAAISPMPLSERQKRLAQLPRFKAAAMQATPEQFDDICYLFKTNHEEVVLNIIAKSLLGTSVSDSQKLDDHLDLILQQFSELKPESYLESMLLAQIIQVSTAAGNCMERAFHKDQTFVAKEMYANLAIKFQRTFVAQIEALQKLRGKGGQKVTVEHVHVHEGGQAIVGNINHATGGEGKNEK